MLLIDGYNLLFAGRRDRIDFRELDKERERLVRLLQRYCRMCGQKAVIIFDHTKGPPIYGEPLRRVLDEAVEVRFTTEDVSADDEIIGTVEATSDRTAYTVVTSDRKIVEAVEKRQVRVIRSANFADDVEKLLKDPGANEKERTLSKEEVDFWMKEFGIGDHVSEDV